MHAHAHGQGPYSGYSRFNPAGPRSGGMGMSMGMGGAPMGPMGMGMDAGGGPMGMSGMDAMGGPMGSSGDLSSFLSPPLLWAAA